MPRPAKELLAEFDTLTRQLADANGFRDRLESDMAAATDALDLADEKAVAALQTKKAQLELAPRKLAQLEQKIAALEPEADALVSAESQALSRRAGEQREKWQARLVKAVRPFCQTEQEAERLARETWAMRMLAGTGTVPPRIGTEVDRLRRALDAEAEYERFIAALEKAAK